MANIYVRSTDGDNADDGSTWALAKATIEGAFSAASAGDTIFVSQAHSQDAAASINMASPGTYSAPVKVLCVNDSAEPPTASTTGALLAAVSNAWTLSHTGVSYFRGIKFRNYGATPIGGNNVGTYWEDCTYEHMHGSYQFQVATSSTAPRVCFKNVHLKFGGTTTNFSIYAHGAYFEWDGGGLTSDSSAITLLCQTATSAGRNNYINLSGLDLQYGASTMDIFSAAGGLFIVRNCRLPASWTGKLMRTNTISPWRAEMHNCDSGNTNYKIKIEDIRGDITQDTGIYLDGGVTDGTTSLSYRHASNANCSRALPLRGPDLIAWNDTTGSSKTATIQIVHDGATALTNNEVWVELFYMGSTTHPNATLGDDAGDPVGAGSTQATSSSTWTGDTGTGPNGSSTWNQLKLEVSFTPQQKGPVIARVMLGKASTTVFVDPNVTIT